jgi:hypothetical protein
MHISDALKLAVKAALAEIVACAPAAPAFGIVDIFFEGFFFPRHTCR